MDGEPGDGDKHSSKSCTRETAREVITRNQRLKKIIDEQAEAERPLKTPQPMSNSGPSVAGNSATRPASSAPKTTPATGHDLVAETNQLRQKVVAQEDTEKTQKQQISQDFTSASRKKNKRIVLSKGSDLRPPRRRKRKADMDSKDVQSHLIVEVMRLLQKFQPGGDLGPIEDRAEWENRVQSHAPQEWELLQELTRFADLWRYFQENKEKLGPEILAALKEAPRLAVAERIARLKEINQKLMERILDAGEGPDFRN